MAETATEAQRRLYCEQEILTIVFFRHGWFLFDLWKQEALQGPYTTHQEAVEAIETRAHRLAQGWEP